MLHQITKSFHYIEFASGDGKHLPKELEPNLVELVQNLQVLRDYIDTPIIINSGYRSPEHNKAVGGAPNSYHVKAMASDIRTHKHSPQQLASIILKLMNEGKMKKGGLKAYNSFVHYDIRGAHKTW